MRQLKRAMWKDLRSKSKDTEKENFDITQAVNDEENVNKDMEYKNFSNLYMNLPGNLTKLNIESISPSIAFVTLLHLANENNFKIEKEQSLEDLAILGVQSLGQ